MKLHTYMIAALVALCLLFPGCTPSKDSDLKKDIAYFTSEECGGRMPGSPGNLAAQTYIYEKFKVAGLTPLENFSDYLQPYTQLVFNPEQESQTLTATYADGHTQVYLSGRDFYPHPVTTPLSYSSNLTSFPSSTEGDRQTIPLFTTDQESELNIICSDVVTAHIRDQKEALPVSPDLFEALTSSVSLSLEGVLITEKCTVQNIIGVRKGTSSEKALLLTAHFDHVGSTKNVLYPGAVDNASGIATLLQVLKLLDEQNVTLPFDVVFCAFNGEDMGIKGSTAFSRESLPYQLVNAINLDTIGMVGVSELVVSTTDNTISNRLSTFLTSVGLPCVQDQVGMSDHQALLAAGIPAVNLGDSGDAYTNIMHTQNDNSDQIDTLRLLQVANALIAYMDTAEITAPNPTSDGRMDRLFQAANTEAQRVFQQYKPERDEVVLFEVDGETFVTWDSSKITDINLVRALYPTFLIPTQVGDFQFESFQLAVNPLRVQMVLGNEGYTAEPVQKKTGAELNHDCILKYKNKTGTKITFSLESLESYNLESHFVDDVWDEIEVPEGTIYRFYETINGSKRLRSALFYHEHFPYALHLNLNSTIPKSDMPTLDPVLLLTELVHEITALMPT